MQKLHIYRFRFVIIWVLFILFACGAQPGTLTKLKLDDLLGYDKPIHAFLFGMQAWLIIIARLGNGTKKIYIIQTSCLISAAYGVGIEFMQKWLFTGRSYDYFDMLANIIGCFIVYFIAKRKFTTS
jgi:VanZ family protein